MTSSEFTSYLSGLAAGLSAPPTAAQWAEVVARLDTVFTKVTPNRFPAQDPTMRDETRYCAGPERHTYEPPTGERLLPFRGGDDDIVNWFSSVSVTC